jgi:dTMP kinase
MRTMVAGRFITLEGGEGAGKSTQAALLADALAELGVPVLRTREPGGASGAETLRGLLLDGGIDWSPLAETLLHFAARAQHVAKTIQPALDAGMWVVCDRFYDSTTAYQGCGQGVDRGVIATLIGILGVVPDVTLVLDVTEQAAATRRLQRGGGADRYERLDAGFHARVRQGFRDIAAAEPSRCVRIAADGSREEVHAAITQALRERVPLSSSEG